MQFGVFDLELVAHRSTAVAHYPSLCNGAACHAQWPLAINTGVLNPQPRRGHSDIGIVMYATALLTGFAASPGYELWCDRRPLGLA